MRSKSLTRGRSQSRWCRLLSRLGLRYMKLSLCFDVFTLACSLSMLTFALEPFLGICQRFVVNYKFLISAAIGTKHFVIYTIRCTMVSNPGLGSKAGQASIPLRTLLIKVSTLSETSSNGKIVEPLLMMPGIMLLFL